MHVSCRFLLYGLTVVLGFFFSSSLVLAELNGMLTAKHPYVGLFVNIDDQGAIASFNGCSGTLVGNRAIVTAAHCVYTKVDDDPSYTGFFIPALGVYRISNNETEIHPDYIPRKTEIGEAKPSLGDLAIVYLEDEIAISSPVTFSETPVKIGSQLEVVSHGPNLRNTSYEGKRQVGLAQISNCTKANEEKTICIPYSGAGSDFSTCKGDSGGALFVKNNSTLVGLVSYASRGQEAECNEKAELWNTELAPYHPWLTEKVGKFEAGKNWLKVLMKRDVSNQDSTVLELNSSVIDFGNEWYIDLNRPSSKLRIVVSSPDRNYQILIVALSDDEDNPACRVNPHKIKVCEIDNPTTGMWHVAVKDIRDTEEFPTEQPYHIVISVDS